MVEDSSCPVSASYAHHSHSACPTPCAIPPWVWPWRIMGFTARPQSSTVVYRASSTTPVSGSISTSQTAVPYGNEGWGMVSSLRPSSGPRQSGGASPRAAAAATRNRSTQRSAPFTVNRRPQHPGGDPCALLDDLIRRFGHHDGRQPERPRRVCAAADDGDIGVARDQAHGGVIDAQPLDQKLGEAGRVPLP